MNASPGTTRSALQLLMYSLLTLPLVATGVAAQSGEYGEARTIPNIDIRGVLPADARYAPGAVGLLTSEEMESLRPYTLHDAFDFIPGVRTVDDDALGRRSAIGIRGASPRRSRKTLLLEDGTPINASTYLDSSAHYTPPMQRLERVEVLKANGQVLHGPLNNHGIVNFRNKRATDTPETTVELAAGNRDTFNRHLMHRRRINDVGVVLSYTGQNADGVFDTEETQWDDLYGSLEWDIGERHNIFTSFTYFRERADGYDESNLTPQEYFGGNRTSKRDRFGQEFNSFDLDYYKFDISHEFRISDRLTSSTRFFTTRVDRPRFTVIPETARVAALGALNNDPANVERPFVEGVSGRMESRDRLYRTFGAENRMALNEVELFGASHNFQWGLRVERHLFDDRRFRANNGGVLDSDNESGDGLARDEVYQASAVSVFIQDSIVLGDWTITPGLRAEWFEQTKVGKPLVTPFARGGDPLERDKNSVLIPGLSFLYDGFEDTQVFASVQRGYSPAIARTAEGFPLVPETGINSQIGVRSTAIRGLSMDAAVFYNMLQNTLVRQAFTIDGQNVTLNDGDSEAWGFDLGLRVDSSAFMQADYNLYGMLAWNYTRSEFTSGPFDGNRVPEIALHSGSFTFGMSHVAGWDISATVSHLGSFFTDSANTRAITMETEIAGAGDAFAGEEVVDIREPVVTGIVEDRTLLSARASYKLQNLRDTTVWIQGRNLTNERYITDLENGIRPGAERTVMGGVTFRF